MIETNNLVTHIGVTVSGSAVDPKIMQGLKMIMVNQHIHLPDVFTLCFEDPDFELIDQGPFELTKKIKIQVEKEDGSDVTLIEGEITALEPNFKEGMLAELIVHGYDVSHCLFREKKSKSYLNQKDSDLAEEIARAAKLDAKVESTPTVYEHIFQHNQTDLAFLMERAWRIGYECFVRDGALFFRKPPQNGEALELTWGNDLLSFRPRLNLAEQVDEVTVRGWDAEKLKPIIGRAQKGHLYPGAEVAKSGADLAKPFGRGNLVVVDQPVVSQAEADALAAARMDETSGTLLEARGRCLWRPDILAGGIVRLKALGTRFSGDYLVTSATHTYSEEGLITTFEVRGARTGLLREALAPGRKLDRWPGVVVGMVTNTDDPRGWGRVKLIFPWLTENAESDWARVAAIGGGPEAGLVAIPAVGDEVLVAFMNGNFSQPFVLGGLWNGKHKLPTQTGGAAKGKKPQVRVWRSINGHSITMYDDDQNKIEIATAGGHKIILDDANNKIMIESKNEIQLTANGNMTIKASGGNLNLEADKQVNIKGSTVNLN